jgi:hypothetical protein
MTTFEVCYLLSSILVGIFLPVYLLKAYPKYQQFWWNVLPTSPAVVVAVLLEKWYKIPFGLYLATILLGSMLAGVLVALLYRLIYQEKPKEPEQA